MQEPWTKPQRSRLAPQSPPFLLFASYLGVGLEIVGSVEELAGVASRRFLSASPTAAATTANLLSSWWRLSCHQTLPGGWHLCNVGLFSDTGCGTSTLSSPTSLIKIHYSGGGGFAGTSSAQFVREWHSAASATGEVLHVWRDMVYVGGHFQDSFGVTCAKVDSNLSNCAGGFAQLGTNGARGSPDVGPTGCNEVHLQRSDDGLNWRNAAIWYTPGSSLLRLNDSDWREGSQLEPLPFSSAVSGCHQCGRAGTMYVDSTATLRIPFSSEIYPGPGNLIFNAPGSQPANLWVPALDSRWFSFEAEHLVIRPQRSLGPSAGCSIIKIEPNAVVNLGQIPMLSQNDVHVCIRDSEKPQLSSIVPPHDAQNVDVRPQIQLAFNEWVTVAASAGGAVFKPKSRVGANVKTISVDLNSQQTTMTTWEPSIQARALTMTLAANDSLIPGVRYELSMPFWGIADRAGNYWEGGSTLTFRVGGNIGAPLQRRRRTAPVTLSADNRATAGSPPDVAIIATPLIMSVCVCLAAFFIIRWYLREVGTTKRSSRDAGPTTASEIYQTRSSPSMVSCDSTTTPKLPTSSVSESPQAAGTCIGAVDKSSTDASASPMAAAGSMPEQCGDFSWETRASGHSTDKHDNGGRSSGERSVTAPQPQAWRRQKAKEAEDVYRKRRSHPPFRGAGSEAFRHRSSFDDTNLLSGAWVDGQHERGRQYYQNLFTQETQWNRPPKVSNTKASLDGARRSPTQPHHRPASARAASSRQHEQYMPPTSPPGSVVDEEEEFVTLEASRVQASLLDQMKKSLKDDPTLRKKTFKFLCIRWHPDKNKDNPETATKVFQFIQQQKAWFLDGVD